MRALALVLTFAACAPATPAPTPPPVRVVAVAPVDAAPPGPNKATGVFFYRGSRCVTLDDRTVRCWVQGTTDNPPTAVEVPAFADGAQVAGTCALGRDGSVVCWEGNVVGLQADGKPTARATPVPVAGLSDVTQLHAGGCTCALRRDRTLWCWGKNDHGQLGDGTTVSRATPVQVPGVHDVSSFAISSESVLAVLADGTLMAWGGSLALGTGSTDDRPTPAPVPGLRDVVEADADEKHACARLKDGSLWCWGVNVDGTQQEHPSPTRVPGLSGVAGFRLESLTFAARTCAWQKDGKAVCWGDDSGGATSCDGANKVERFVEGPDFTRVDCVRPTVVAGLDGVTRVEMSMEASFALLRSGAIRRWGGSDQQGFGAALDPAVSVPTVPGAAFDPIGRSDVVDMAADDDAHACVVTTAGEVYCTDSAKPGIAVAWASSAAAPDGDAGSGVSASSPRDASTDSRPVAPVHKAIAIAMSAGGHACAILDDRTVHCRKSGGVTGLVPGLSDVTKLALSDRLACALRVDGTVRCWGGNDHGELGDGTTTPRAGPVPVVGLSDVVEVQTDGGSSCARRRDGTLWCWGMNYHGELGDGTKVHRAVPVQAVGVKSVASYTLGDSSVLALLEDGTLMAWGADYGGVGNRFLLRADSPTPVPMRGLRDVVEVRTGGSTCARRKDGSLWCWGFNGDGEVGDGTRKPRWLPTRVPGQSGVVGFRVTLGRTCAWHADGKVACWGTDGWGAAGCGGQHTIKRESPAPMGLQSWAVDCMQPTVVAGVVGVARVEMDYYATYALLRSGATSTWGHGDAQAYGPEPTIVLRTPEDGPIGTDPFGRTDVVDLVTGGPAACILTAAGQVFCDDSKPGVPVSW